MTEYNYVPNPRFHIDVAAWQTTDYAKWGPAELPSRATSVAFGALPDGADAVGDIATTQGASVPNGIMLFDAPTAGDYDWTQTIGAYTEVSDCECWCYSDIYWWDAAWNIVGSSQLVGYSAPYSWTISAWHEPGGTLTVPVGAVYGTLLFDVWPGLTGTSSVRTGHGYLTKIRIGGLDYADGDTPGWEWTGTAHNTVSQSVEAVNDTVLLINGGASMVFDTAVTLTLNPGTTGAESALVWNDGYEGDAETVALAGVTSHPWTLVPDGRGMRKVWANFSTTTLD